MTDCTRRARSYWTTCDCPPCVKDRLRAHKRINAGLYKRVPSDAAWKVLAEKIDAGWTAMAIGSATGLGRHYFTRHLAEYRKGRRVYLGPAAAAAVVNMGTPTEGQVGVEPSRRRLRGLATLAHGLATIAAETGIGFSTLAAIRNDNSVRCSAANAALIRDVYERLCMTIGDDIQAQRIAREKRWKPPLSWNNIDDLAERSVWRRGVPGNYVDPARVQRLLDGVRIPSSAEEKREAMRRWLADGKSARSLAVIHGWQDTRYVSRKDGAA